MVFVGKSGTPARIRTWDQRIRNPLLLPLWSLPNFVLPIHLAGFEGETRPRLESNFGGFRPRHGLKTV